MIKEIVKLDILDLNGKIVREFSIEKNKIDSDRGIQAVHDVITFYNNNLRSWTASTKTRGLVSGGGIKPYRQKGTGRARVGSIRSPIRVGGGTVFGPNSSEKPARKKVNRKVISLAMNKIFSEKLISFNIKILDDSIFDYENCKTKNTLEILKNLNVVNNKILIVVNDYNDNLVNSVSNIFNIKLRKSNSVNSYDLLNSEIIIFSESSIKNFVDRLNKFSSKTIKGA